MKKIFKLNQTHLQPFLPLLPIRHHSLQQQLEFFIVIKMNQVAKFMYDNIFNTAFWGSYQLSVQDNELFSLFAHLQQLGNNVIDYRFEKSELSNGLL